MRIAILGSRGIPANYGGTETVAEIMSPIFQQLGHAVTVYSPDEHPYTGATWRGIQLKRIFNQERKLGIWGTLIYDFLCLKDAVASEFDIILELGNVPCAIFFPFFHQRNSKLITNMDGLEWKRAKWNVVLQKFAKLTEALGARCSDALIADNEGIREYLRQEYGRDSYFIPYGALAVSAVHLAHLQSYALEPRRYHMLIARLEPENNIEMIVDGFLAAADKREFIVVGKIANTYGRRLVAKYQAQTRVRFVGGIYDYAVLSSLRWYAEIYFHGHSVGGTNPSLLEAMASSAFIAAHDNVFNRSVLGADACYFSSVSAVVEIIDGDYSTQRAAWVTANLTKVEEIYTWDRIAREYLRVFASVLAEGPQNSA